MRRQNKIFVVFGFPINKHWLAENLKSKYGDNVRVIAFKRRLKDSVLRGARVVPLLKTAFCLIGQSLKIMFKSRRNDVIVCWDARHAFILNFYTKILFSRRKIIAMHCLSPKWGKGGIYKKIHRISAKSKDMSIVVNDRNGANDWAKYLDLKNTDNYYFIPDVYGDAENFYDYSFKDKRYCFTGGMNNRDWSLIANLAERNPNIEFVCVALENDFKKQVESIPQNMTVYYSLPSEEYYSLMKGAYLVLLPLKSKIVAGLINITKSAFFCVPCCITKTSSAEIYFSDERFLIEDGLENWERAVNSFYTMGEDEYKRTAVQYQKYIKDNFSPQSAIDKLTKIIDKYLN